MIIVDKFDIPESVKPKNSIEYFFVNEFKERDEFIKKFGFARVNWTWIKELAKYIGDKKVLEIMCGTGSLSYALSTLGVDIIATDNMALAKKSGSQYDNWPVWNKVIEKDAADAIEEYGASCSYILCSWPPYQNLYAYNSLMKMREINPNAKMIFIGEDMGGCTANDIFFAEAKEITDDKKFNEINQFYTRWSSIHDMLMLFK